MANKTTKKDNFKTIKGLLEELGRDDLVQVMAHEIELLEKKSSNKTPNKNQIANEDIKELIVNALKAIGEPVTITDLIKKTPELAERVGNSNQKVSALMTQLKNDNIVVRTQDKKTALFSIAE